MTWLEFRDKIIHESKLDYFLRASLHLLSLKYGMVWYGVVWCGIWCGVWCGGVWFGFVWCGLVWSGLLKKDLALLNRIPFTYKKQLQRLDTF